MSSRKKNRTRKARLVKTTTLPSQLNGGAGQDASGDITMEDGSLANSDEPHEEPVVPNTISASASADCKIRLDLSTPASAQGYTLRARNTQSSHPANAVGLYKRSRDEITAIADVKRAKRQAIDDVKREQQEREDLIRVAGLQRIAELEDEYAQEDAEDIEQISTWDHQAVSDPDDVDSQTVQSGSESEQPRTLTKTRKKTLTAAEKREALRKSTLGAIQGRRAVQDVLPHGQPGPVIPAAGSSTKPSASKHDAFNSTWRRRLIEQNRGISQATQSSPSRPSSRPGVSPGPTAQLHKDSVTPSPAGRTSRPSARKEDGHDSDRQEVGGFRDEDVAIDREATLLHMRSRKGSKESPIQFHAGSDGEESAHEHDIDTISPKKGKKASPSSIGFDALPPWIQPCMKLKIIPSLLEYYGTRNDPWGPDATDRNEFLRQLQDIVNTVYPKKMYPLKKSNVIYRYSRQRVYDWHRDIQKIANYTVRDAYNERQHNADLSKRDRTDKAVVEWMRTQLTAGAAYYGEPKTNTNPVPMKLFHSPYLLKTIAYHLIRTSGSVMPDPGYPGGALALCGAAVQRAFTWYINDRPLGKKQAEFSVKEAGSLTIEWRDNNVARLLSKPHRVDRLLQAATEAIPDVPSLRDKGGIVRSSMNAGNSGAPMLDDPSSPIAPPSDDDNI